MHGYRPQLEECACCGAEVGDSRAVLGGSRAACCARRAARSTRAPCASARGARVARAPPERAHGRDPGLEMPPAAVADCFALVRAFVAYHVPARLRALDFYAAQCPSR